MPCRCNTESGATVAPTCAVRQFDELDALVCSPRKGIHDVPERVIVELCQVIGKLRITDHFSPHSALRKPR